MILSIFGNVVMSLQMKHRFLKCLAGALFLSTSLMAEPLAVGDKLPPVVSINQLGEEVSLETFAEEKWLLVYFYPKADTPGCTKQACSLRDSYEVLTEKGVKVIGVSADTPADQKAFLEKHKLPFILLADVEKKVIEAFGVPNFKGKQFAQRQAYLFKEGELIWRDLKAATNKQATEVLKAMKTL